MAQAGSENKEPWNEETRAKFEGYVLVSLPHGMTADCLREEEERIKWLTAKLDTYRKSRSEYLDPCQEAAQRSIRCLHRNQGDRTMCSDYFEAYRECKKQWVSNSPLRDWEVK